MKKQLVWWKPHQRTSPTWVFFTLNNNQQVDLKQSQIMRCIVCHRETTGPEIVALCTRCCIVYNRSNGILTMMKHVEQDHASLFRWFREELDFHYQPPSNHEPPTKRQQIALSSILSFFFFPTPFPE